jgi:hypothetical protein
VDRIGCAARDVGVVLAQAERVTVAGRTGGAANADAATCASHILDDDRLAEKRLHPLGEIARDDVGRASRGIGHDDGDRPRRIGLRHCDPRDGRKRGSTRCQMQKLATWKARCVPSERMPKQHGCLDGTTLRPPAFRYYRWGHCSALANLANAHESLLRTNGCSRRKLH